MSLGQFIENAELLDIFAQRYDARQKLILKLKRCMSRAAAFNPADAPLAPDVTMSVTTTLPSGLVLLNALVSSPQVYAYSGGVPTPTTAAGPTKIAMPVMNVSPAVGNLSGLITSPSNLSANAFAISYNTEDPITAISFLPGSATSKFRVIVNGQYVSKSFTQFATLGVQNYVVLEFSSPRRVNTITIEAGGSTLPHTIYGKITARPHKPFIVDPVTAFWTGDSYSVGEDASDASASWAIRGSHRLGWSDPRVPAIGTTGYDTPGIAVRVPDQIERWLAVNTDVTDIDVAVVASAFNDLGKTPSVVAGKAVETVAAIRDIAPLAPIFVVGPWMGIRDSNPTHLAIETAVLSAIDGINDPFVFGIPNSTANPPWTYGTGTVSAKNGSGNSDENMINNLHPSDTGQNHHADCFVNAARRILAGL